MPRYSFLLTRFAGGSVRHGSRYGATPDSSCLMIDSVTISYAVGISEVLLFGVDFVSTEWGRDTDLREGIARAEWMHNEE